MLEQTLVVGGEGSPTLLTSTPPPDGFRPVGEISTVKYEVGSPWNKRRRYMTGSQIAGLAHEKKGHKFFQSSFGPKGDYKKSPWISFKSNGSRKRRWCQPDGLLFQEDLNLITIVEYKLKHTSDAWWQLRHLYEPIIKKLRPGWDIRILEVVKYPDPDQVIPEPTQQVKKFEECGSSFNWAILKDISHVNWRDLF